MRKKSLDQCLSYEILDASQKMGIARKKGMGGSLASVSREDGELQVYGKYGVQNPTNLILNH